MSLRVNDPCPCGSGLKYKKCCLSKKPTAPPMETKSSLVTAADLKALLSQQKRLHSSDAVATAPLQPDAPQTLQPAIMSARAATKSHEVVWPQAASALPKRFISREEEQQHLSSDHIAFQKHIEMLARANTPASAREGLALLETIPQEEAYTLEWYGKARGLLLQQLGQREAGLFTSIEQMFAIQDERAWLTWGPRLLQWLQKFPDAAQAGEVLQKLRETVAASPFIAPRLLLAYRLWMEPSESPQEEAVALYKEALLLKPWPWKRGKRGPSQSKLFRRSEGEWLGAISDGYQRLLRYLLTRDEGDELRRYTRQFHLFPWEQIEAKFRQLAVRMMSSIFYDAAMPDDILQICERFAPLLPHCPYRMYWKGQAYRLKGDHATALGHFRKMGKYAAEVEEHTRLAVIDYLLSQGHVEATRPFLDALEDREATITLQLWYWYHHLSGAHEEALEHVERWLAREPDHFEAMCRRFRDLELSQRHEQLIAELTPMLAHEDESRRLFAHVCLGIHYTLKERHKEALALFDALPDTLLPEVFLEDRFFRCQYLSCFGDCLEQQERWEEAERCYQQVIDIRPQPWTYARLMLYYCRRDMFEDAAALLAQARQIDPDDFYVKYTQLQLALHHEQPKEAKALLEALGKESFVERESLRDWLWCWLRVWLDTGAPLQALELSEEYLDEIRKDDELREIRASLFADVVARHRELEAQLGQQESLQLKMEQTRKLLRHKSQESHRRQEALQKLLREKTALHEALQERQDQRVHEEYIAAEPLSQLLQQRESLIDALTPNNVQLLRHAERLWTTMAAHPDEDHGPIILQLARIVEGELNLRMIDRLTDLAQAQHIPLSSLPQPALGQLKRAGNRLSLGDASKLLYHILISTDDGSRCIQRNPYSNDAHKALLEQFWQHPSRQTIATTTRDYLQGPLIQDLTTLARHRNQASHAGHPIPRQQAHPLRNLVLGTTPGQGMLEALIQLPGGELE